MKKTLRVAIGSTTSLPGQVKANLEQIRMFAERAASEQAHLLLTPELSATGYGGYPEVIACAEKAGRGPIYEQLAQWAAQFQLVLCAGFVEYSEGFNYLSHYAIYPDGSYVSQRKHRVTYAEQPLHPAFPQRPPYNPDGTGQPEKIEINAFTVHNVQCALVICADFGIVGLNEILAKLEVKLVLIPTGAGGNRSDCVSTSELHMADGRRRYFEILQTVYFPGDASDCISYRRSHAAVNLCGYDGRRHYHRGHGSIVNPMGETVAFFHGQPNLDRQRPAYACGLIDFSDCLPTGT